MNCIATLALPRLSSGIPTKLHLAGAQGDLATSMAIALIEANIITDKMLRPRAGAPLTEVFFGPSEKELASRALSKWWSELCARYPTRHFCWKLHVQELEPINGYENKEHPVGWFCLQRVGDDIPRFALSRRTMELEDILPGFGQTILAVLFDAMMLMPDSLNPWIAVDWAEWLHWSESETDEELLEHRREEEGMATHQEVIDSGSVLTRAMFYADMPEWVARPRRVVSRRKIVKATKSEFPKDVVAACDALLAAVSQPGFKLQPPDCGCHQSGFDSIDGCVVLLWREFDVVSQVIDDALNQLGQAGEYSEMIDMHPVSLTAAGIEAYQARTEQLLQVAVQVERLLELIGDPL